MGVINSFGFLMVVPSCAFILNSYDVINVFICLLIGQQPHENLAQN